MRLTELNPQCVIVVGGAGSGKNHYIETSATYSKYTLIDVDEIKQTVDLSTAILSVVPALKDAFGKGINVAHPTTGSNGSALLRKIQLAHLYGYTVILVLIDTDPATAINQVRNRVRQGGHDVEIDAIVKSNKKARENFNAVKAEADKSTIVQ